MYVVYAVCFPTLCASVANMSPIIIYPHAVELGVIDFICESIRYGKSKTNMVRLGFGHVVRSLHIAQHTTFQIMKEN